MEEKQIKKIVKETIRELFEQKMIRNDVELSYKFISKILFRYYHGAEMDHDRIKDCLEKLSNDQNFPIIEFYYRDGKTVEQTAEAFGCDTSTVVRHKRRIALEIYDRLYNNY